MRMLEKQPIASNKDWKDCDFAGNPFDELLDEDFAEANLNADYDFC